MIRDMIQGYRAAIRSPNLRFRAGPAFELGQRFGRLALNPYIALACEAAAFALGVAGIAAGIVALYAIIHVI